MFSGIWPFNAKNQEELDDSLENGTEVFHIFENMLPKDKDLLSLVHKMLQQNPEERPSINEVLCSKWLREYDSLRVSCVNQKSTKSDRLRRMTSSSALEKSKLSTFSKLKNLFRA